MNDIFSKNNSIALKLNTSIKDKFRFSIARKKL